MKAVRLRTEYLENPIGLGLTAPRFFWQCDGGIRQEAYQITAWSASGKRLWDSGKMPSSRMTGIKYGGAPLTSRERVVWQVTLWDENGLCEVSAPAYFELGLLHPSDFRGQWITGNDRVNRKKRYPVDCFRKAFTLNKAVKSARLYITTCGLYEATINGKKAGDAVLAPGLTDYRVRTQYQTYDVTSLLREGDNECRVELADGWYRGSVGAHGLRNQYGSQTKFLAQLEITHADDSLTVIYTDSTWDWSNDGALRFADMKDGETIDARMQPSYSGKAKTARCRASVTASNSYPVKEMERFACTVTTTPSGKRLLDFGVNLAGYIEFSVTAKAGDRITLRMGEKLDPSGELTLANIQCKAGKKLTPLQQINYTCKAGENRYKTKFAVFGFRYAEIDAPNDIEINPARFTAVAVYSAFAQTGFFESSTKLLDRFVACTLRSAKSNSVDIPTDCPTRERHGWTGDAQIFCETANYLLDYLPFTRKYLRDIYDRQSKSGKLPQIAPYGGVDFYMRPMNGSVGWADAGIIIPYRLWKMYNDTDILREYYPRMKKYARFMIGRIGRRGVVRRGQSYGEWAEPSDVRKFNLMDMAFPHPEVSTAYTAHVMGLMAEIAAQLGFDEDADNFRQHSNKCRRAYQAYVSEEKHSLNTDRQALLVRPLAFGLLNDEQTKYAKERLVQALEHYHWRIGTGFLSTPLILDVLAKIDIRYAYKLLENEDKPGWLSMPKSGATTVWEHWEGTSSLNHYSKGAMVAWLFNTACGIHIAGDNHFDITPMPGGSLTHARATYHSIFGTVKSGWEKRGDSYVYSITIPPNCTADITLHGKTTRLTAGEYALYDNKEEDT